MQRSSLLLLSLLTVALAVLGAGLWAWTNAPLAPRWRLTLEPRGSRLVDFTLDGAPLGTIPIGPLELLTLPDEDEGALMTPPAWPPPTPPSYELYGTAEGRLGSSEIQVYTFIDAAAGTLRLEALARAGRRYKRRSCVLQASGPLDAGRSLSYSSGPTDGWHELDLTLSIEGR